MPNTQNNGVVNNPWRRLREFTDARIGLGRAGISLPTRELLEFQLAHAQARDAVHFPLDATALSDALSAALSNELSESTVSLSINIKSVHSQAIDRVTYLQRPDLGRFLHPESRAELQQKHDLEEKYDLAIAIVDGLSSRAVANNVVPFLETLLPQLSTDQNDWRIAPLTLVEQGRVAIGDEIGELLNARIVIVLIGERPGLSSPDSLGLYLTWNPRVGLTDANRNCISNIRPAGLSYIEAARRTLYLLRQARQRQLSGVNLKDRTEDDVVDTIASNTNFLIS